MSMSTADKLAKVKAVLNIANDSLDTTLTAYLDIASREIISWRYSLAPSETVPTEVPVEYEMTQVMAVVTGFTQRGAEGETMHQENGFIHRFSYPDMLHYIHVNVLPIARVI